MKHKKVCILEDGKTKIVSFRKEHGYSLGFRTIKECGWERDISSNQTL